MARGTEVHQQENPILDGQSSSTLLNRGGVIADDYLLHQFALQNTKPVLSVCPFLHDWMDILLLQSDAISGLNWQQMAVFLFLLSFFPPQIPQRFVHSRKFTVVAEELRGKVSQKNWLLATGKTPSNSWHETQDSHFSDMQTFLGFFWCSVYIDWVILVKL